MSNIKNKIKLAEKSIVLIDDYVDEESIEVLSEKQDGVKVEVYSKNKLMTNLRNIKRRRGFRAGFRFLEAKCFRNMYLLIDEKFLFMLSRSIRYNAKRSFWFIQILDINEIDRIRNKIRECDLLLRGQYRHF